MFARVATIQFQGNLDQAAANTEKYITALKASPGFKSAFWLVDRRTRKGMNITFWESLELMREAEEAHGWSSSGASQAAGSQGSLERYEVIAEA